MSWKASQWAVAQRAGSPAAKAILLVLAEACKDATCFLKQETIADRAEVDRRTVGRQLKQLEQRGLISRKARFKAGGRSSDEIALLADAQGDEVSQSQSDRMSPSQGDKLSCCVEDQSDITPGLIGTPRHIQPGVMSQEPDSNREEEPERDSYVEQPAFALVVAEDAPDPIREALASWNDVAGRCGLAKARDLTETRRTGLRKLLKRLPSGGWITALGHVEASEFLQGGADGSGWRVTLDWLLKPQNITKLMEGAYAARARTGAANGQRRSPLDWAKEGLQ